MEGTQILSVTTAAVVGAITLALGANLKRHAFVRFWAGRRWAQGVWAALGVIHMTAGGLVGAVGVATSEPNAYHGVGWILRGIAAGVISEALLRADVHGGAETGIGESLSLLVRAESRIFFWAERQSLRGIQTMVDRLSGTALMRLARLTGPHIPAGTVADVATRAAAYDQSWALALYDSGTTPTPDVLPPIPAPDWNPPALTVMDAEEWLGTEARRRIVDQQWVADGHKDSSALSTWLSAEP